MASSSPTDREHLTAQVRRWEDAVEWQRAYVERLSRNANTPDGILMREKTHLRGLQAQLYDVQQQLRRLRERP